MLQQMGQLHFLSGSLAQSLVCISAQETKRSEIRKNSSFKIFFKNLMHACSDLQMETKRVLKVINGWPREITNPLA